MLLGLHFLMRMPNCKKEHSESVVISSLETTSSVSPFNSGTFSCSLTNCSLSLYYGVSSIVIIEGQFRVYSSPLDLSSKVACETSLE